MTTVEHDGAKAAVRDNSPSGGSSETRRLLAGIDWGTTPLGPRQAWPQPLTITLDVALRSALPMFIWWGPQSITLYNDACIPLLGPRHPDALGQPAEAVWRESWTAVAQRVDWVLGEGRGTTGEALPLIVTPEGVAEEIHHGFALSPIADGASGVGGILCVGTGAARHLEEPLSGSDPRRLDALQRERSLRREAETLNEVSLELATELDLEALLRKVTDAARELAGAQFGAFFYNAVDAGGESYRLFTIAGAPREVFERLGMPRDTPLFDATYQERGNVRLDDVLEDLRYGRNAPHAGMPEGHPAVRSYLAVPVISRSSGKTLGGLFLGHGEPGVFTARAERLVQGVAAEAGVAIDNAELYARAIEARSERERVEDALRLSERRFHAVIQHAPVAVFVKDLEGRYTLANPMACEALGRAEGVDGLTDHDLLSADAADRLRAVDRMILDSGQTRQGEETVSRPGYDRQYLSVKFPLLADDGTPIGLAGVATDITDQKRTEAELRESEARFRHMADNSPVMIWVTEPDGRCSFLNRSWYDFTGQGPEAGLGLGWVAAMHPDDRAETESAYQTATANREAFRFEYRLRRRDGEYRWTMGAAAPRVGHAGEFLGFIGSVIDVTEQKRNEVALRESEERFRNLADNISQLTWMADESFEIVWFNRRWFEYTGTRAEDMKGWGWRSVHHPDHVDRVVSGIEHSRDTGEPWEDTFPLRGGDGEYRWFLSRAMPIHDETGRLTRWFGSNTDVTEQRAMEQALREADRRKDEFLALLAHELRNPLAPIRTGLELMEQTPAGDDVTAGTRRMMSQQVEQMSRLIDDLMDVSRITRGKMQLQRRHVKLAEIVTPAVDAMRPLVERSGHRLSVSMPDEPLVLDADANRLAQIFTNLLSNAAKYMSRGGHVRLVAERQGTEKVAVRVRDEGIGIPAHLQGTIFEMFSQIEQGHGDDTGLGMGLTLARSLAEMHGGTIAVRSDGPNMGSEFTVLLPLVSATSAQPPAMPAPASHAPVELSRRRVLVVDDNDAAVTLLSLLLEKLGQDVTMARNGLEAIEAAERTRPDVILMDIGMPDMDGYEAARRIREHPWGKEVRLVALTGWGQADDKRRTREAGFDLHLVKPVARKDLESLLARRVST